MNRLCFIILGIFAILITLTYAETEEQVISERQSSMRIGRYVDARRRQDKKKTSRKQTKKKTNKKKETKFNNKKSRKNIRHNKNTVEEHL